MKILLLSPYDALSHRYWREGLVRAFPEHDFTVVTLPPRHFSWRFHGNGLTLSRDERVLATSMTDLAVLRGLAPALTACPNLVYFHENQFAYPGGHGEDRGLLERQLTSVYTALAADRVLFNSAFNRRTFLDGAGAMLAKMPGHVPAGVIDDIERRSALLPVPLHGDCFRAGRRSPRLSIVWNHRWEFDKGPQTLLDIASALIDRGINFRLHLLGQRFRQVPPDLDECKRRLAAAGRLGECGFRPRPAYLDLLASSHIVLSTALHEFQGLAVQEAVAAGNVPLVPDGLAYPEFFDETWRYASADDAVDRIDAMHQQLRRGERLQAPDVSHLDWARQRDGWADVLDF